MSYRGFLTTTPLLQFILERIVWPVMDEEDDDYDDECTLDEKCRVAGYLRNYIEKGKNILEAVVQWFNLFTPGTTSENICLSKYHHNVKI